MGETRVLLEHVDVPGIEDIDVWEAHDGYQALRKAILQMQPEDVTQAVLQSGLRGRGGAGFPTGRKWTFLPNDGRPRYLVCNADEGEPGTFKDHLLMQRLPHLLVEGMIISSYAIGSHRGFIYLRGEFQQVAYQLQKAIEQAKAKGYLGKNILGTGYDLELTLYLGAGAYICGEESALLDSLEGKRGIPRLKPPFPATHGLYQMPTIVNNVETLAAVVPIVNRGAEWYASMGTERSKGTKLFSISGHVRAPGNYEFELGTTLGEMIETAGGLLPGHQLKAVIPGGASAPLLTPEHLNLPMDYESIAQAGSMLGSGGMIVFDDRTCIVRSAVRIMEFFHHESCGKCTPCREGSGWLMKVLHRLEQGQGSESDLDMLVDLADNIAGKTFCAFGDAEVGVLVSSIKYFREEYLAHLREGACPVGVLAR